MVAEIIINSNVNKLNRVFDYDIPTDMEVDIGTRVFVPFGNKKALEEGIIVAIKEKSDYKIKPIAGIQEEQIHKDYIDLAKWMSKRYFCNVASSLNLMLPPGKTSKDIQNRVKEKTVNFVTLAMEQENIEKAIEDGKIKSEKQKNALEFIMNNGDATVQDIELFTDASRAVVNTLVKNGYLEIDSRQTLRNPFIHTVQMKNENLKLTEEQQNAFEQIEIAGKNLLYGVTGSGKTEIYLRLIKKMLDENKSSIMLVPEISLTPQTVDRFIERFGEEQIAVLHSKLSIGERFDQWNKIKEGKAKIIIGARSAIFSPAVNLGLIIIDEEHDESYSSEMTPRYDAREIAEYLVDKKGITLLLGSATPDMRTFYRAQNGEINLLKLTKRANNSSLPEVEIVDLRQELSYGNKSMISSKLHDEIEKNLETKKQTILYLNRRGFSTFVMCRDCGYTVKCKRCDITLTYHRNEHKLKCHYCGYEQSEITECPECHGTNVRYFGAGTQKLEEEVHKQFPNATTIRMDVDTVNKKNSHEEILNKFKNENIDILIGTQMVVKGHHFPNVTLVGVIAADGNLNIGDFRANEKTFQTLTQVAGRAGREKEEGRVIVQTYNPDNYAIEFSKLQDYDLFFETEIDVRKQLKYPPFCDIIVIDMSAKDIRELKIIAKNVHGYLKQRVINEKFGLLLYSPVPAPIEKIKDRYRMRILIKCKYDERINNLLTECNNEFYKMKKNTARMAIELNPNNML